ncbi:uncharacterized protein LOC118202066 [Stegodyphus dumicola]|uniref:uncharacterized protein LOC118202066 n=1 Tax=Stegodyphus dumicola TaxID=202533 RepID=UPI0015AD37E4|nr:uncharacterized protein LOC118202066 [Stegodyphus dumicola]
MQLILHPLSTGFMKYAIGWPDLILTTSQISPLIQNWKVEKQESLSDRRFITFQIEKSTFIPIIKCYNSPINKILAFSRKIRNSLLIHEQQLIHIQSPEEFENLTDLLLTDIQDTCNEILSQCHSKQLQSLKWWTKDLRIQQKKCRALRRKLKSEGRYMIQSNVLQIYQREQALYKQMIVQAKINSWHQFCTENKNVYGLHHKIGTDKLFTPMKLHLQPTSSQGSSLSDVTINHILDVTMYHIFDTVFPDDVVAN